MFRILGPVLLVVMLAACGSDAPTRDAGAAEQSTTAAEANVVKMFRAPT